LPAVTFGDISPFYFKNNKEAFIDASLTAHRNIAAGTSNEVIQLGNSDKDTLALLLVSI